MRCLFCGGFSTNSTFNRPFGQQQNTDELIPLPHASLCVHSHCVTEFLSEGRHGTRKECDSETVSHKLKLEKKRQ